MRAPSRSPKRPQGELLFFALLLSACSATSPPRDAASSLGDTAQDSTATADASVLPAEGGAQQDGPATQLVCEEPPPTNFPGLDSLCCPEEYQRPQPGMMASVLDLSSPGTLNGGTCGAYLSPQRSITLPASADAYPLRILLPALDGADPDCDALCNDLPDQPATVFGFSLKVPNGLIGSDTGRTLAISVPPPWYFTSGGCGEACAWPCLGGYQEYGVRSCVTLTHGDFGFATGDAQAPSVEAIVELWPSLVEVVGRSCCPYPPR